MIKNKDRSNYFGASDVDKIMGKWTSKTFAEWWIEKLGIFSKPFENIYTIAGTSWEHHILESLKLNLEYDKQVIIEELKLRVNLDGNSADCIYECKTHRQDKPFNLPKKYIQQVNVQMYALGVKKAKIVLYGLVTEDYKNFFAPIDNSRLQIIDVPYDEHFIKRFIVRLKYLSKCLGQKKFPNENELEGKECLT